MDLAAHLTGGWEGGGGVEKVQGAAASPGADDRKMAPALFASGEFLHFLTD